MTIGIVGLGLIGGSLAKAYKRVPGTVLYGSDIDTSIEEFARLSGATDGFLTKDSIAACDCIFLAIAPRAACAWMQENAPLIAKNGILMDCCGTKRRVCEAGFPLAAKYGYEYVGGHPMAGTHDWGFKNSRADLYDGECMVAVPRVFDDIELLERIKNIVLPAGFASISVTTAEKHDELIAFTSQLAHVVSNAYVKSPTARAHMGFSAGSYQDLTRVAWLNPSMWAELLLDNRDMLTNELDAMIASLGQYRAALEKDDFVTMRALLDEGRLCKQEVDGK